MSSIFREANGTRPALFDDIRLVARQEHLRLFGGEPLTPEGKAMMAHASAEAERLVEEARREASAIRERAHRSGFDAGFADGRANGHEQAAGEIAAEREAHRHQIQTLIDRVEQERRQLWLDAEPQIVTFVLEIAAKVVKDEAAVNRDVALSVIRNALRRLATASSLRIRVNIDDLDTVRASREDLVSLLDGVPQIEIVEDRRVGVGGCVIETENGTIDARLETQIHEIGRAIGATMEEAA